MPNNPTNFNISSNNYSSQSFITVISGLPRSGTSMMMKMLSAGGLEIVTDDQRKADEDNPKGYYELERVKKLKDGDTKWLDQTQGKVIKVISALLEYLPENYSYKVIFMKRNMEEILASQQKMLIRRGENPDKVDDQTMAKLFKKHLIKVEAWLAQQQNIDVLYLNYNNIIQDPVNNIIPTAHFLGGNLDYKKMLKIIDKDLYRQRK